MNNDRFISVIVPSYQEIRHIGSCLESLIGQTYASDSYEIIVVDGMSDDGSRDIVNEYISRYPNIKLVDNRRKIVPVAMNLGISEARGDYIMRLDAHAEVPSNYLEKCSEVISSQDVACVGGPVETVGEGFWGSIIAAILSSKLGVGASFRTKKEFRGCVDTIPFGLYNKKWIINAGMYDEALARGQDIELNKRIRGLGGKIFCEPGVKSVYHCKSTPFAFLRKTFKQGYSVMKLPSSLSYRHFVPVLFAIYALLAIVVTLLAGEGQEKYVFIALSPMSIYIMAVIAVSAARFAREGLKKILLMSVLMFMFHVIYGIGSMFGLLSLNWLRK